MTQSTRTEHYDDTGKMHNKILMYEDAGWAVRHLVPFDVIGPRSQDGRTLVNFSDRMSTHFFVVYERDAA